VTEAIETRLEWLSANDAGGAAIVGGPVALARSQFDGSTRPAVCREYLESIGGWRGGAGCAVRGEFPIVSVRKTE
jgi:hypothetical protein